MSVSVPDSRLTHSAVTRPLSGLAGRDLAAGAVRSYNQPLP
jgi:hypothetical protein